MSKNRCAKFSLRLYMGGCYVLVVEKVRLSNRFLYSYFLGNDIPQMRALQMEYVYPRVRYKVHLGVILKL